VPTTRLAVAAVVCLALIAAATFLTRREREFAEAKAMKWRENNREAIAAYNDCVEKHRAFSDGVRSF
jgi:post-segregation antitoxin (ccd killing protein)